MSKDSIILGFNGGHDGSVALVINGKLMAAISKERLTRIKKDSNGNDEFLINFLLSIFGLSIKDVTCITFCDDFIQKSNFIKFYEGNELCGHMYGQTLKEEYLKLEARVEGLKIPAYQIHHHLGHCAYSFYTSNLDKSVCVSVDSSFGEPFASSIIALGEFNKLKLVECPNIFVGNLYNYITSKIGLGDGLYKAGSMMGLSSYGTPLLKVKSNWKDYVGEEYGKYWAELSENENGEWFDESLNDSIQARNIAASVQYIFEQEILEKLSNLDDEVLKKGDFNLCLSGGSFLNCNVNSKIKKLNFNKIHLSPSCSDDGLAAGSALFVAHNILGLKRQKYSNKELMYLGPDYDLDNPFIGKEYDALEVAKLISEGKVVAWYQGRSEFGPRALGNRSLLADPRNKNMRDYMNFKIKKREWFRPFAPSVLKEKANDWFEFEGESPYMLFTCNVKKPNLVPAITHVDNTSRIQTVAFEDNPVFYDLISKFEQITNIPLILNTSFNGKEEPIVETPLDALNFFKNSDVDALVLKNRLILKADLE